MPNTNKNSKQHKNSRECTLKYNKDLKNIVCVCTSVWFLVNAQRIKWGERSFFSIVREEKRVGYASKPRQYYRHHLEEDLRGSRTDRMTRADRWSPRSNSPTSLHRSNIPLQGVIKKVRGVILLGATPLLSVFTETASRSWVLTSFSFSGSSQFWHIWDKTNYLVPQFKKHWGLAPLLLFPWQLTGLS